MVLYTVNNSAAIKMIIEKNMKQYGMFLKNTGYKWFINKPFYKMVYFINEDSYIYIYVHIYMH